VSRVWRFDFVCRLFYIEAETEQEEWFVMVDLSIKGVPEEIAELLRQRAERNNRSLQGELKTILEETVSSSTISLDEAQRRIKDLDLETDQEAVEIIRSLRDDN
jgi:plasmid stability protein